MAQKKNSPTKESEGSILYPVRTALRNEMASPDVKRRRSFLFLSVLSALMIMFTLLALFVSRETVLPIDLKITRYLQSMDHPFFAKSMEGISWFGYAPQSLILTALIAIVLYLIGLHWESQVCVLAVIFEALLNAAIKALIHRPRPSSDLVHVFDELNSFSFPSGHVMFYTCLFGLLLFWAFSLLRASRRRTILSLVFGFPIAIIGISRVYLGEHWASDTLGAYLLGGIALMLSILFYRWGKPRFIAQK